MNLAALISRVWICESRWPWVISLFEKTRIQGDKIQTLEFSLHGSQSLGLQNTWKSDCLMDCLSLPTVQLSSDISNLFYLLFRWREYEDFILFHNHSALSAGDLVTTLLRTRIWNLDTITKNSDRHAVLSESFDLSSLCQNRFQNFKKVFCQNFVTERWDQRDNEIFMPTPGLQQYKWCSDISWCQSWCQASS